MTNNDDFGELMKHHKEAQINPEFERILQQKISNELKAKRQVAFITRLFPLAAAAILIVISVLLLSKSESVQVLDGNPVIQGSRIYTQEKSAKIKLSDSSQISLRHETELRVIADRQVDLVRGNAELDIASNNRQFSVSTKFGKISVLGTKFLADISQNRLFVSVKEGLVVVENKHGSERLQVGYVAFCQDDQKPVKLKEPLNELKKLIKQLGDQDPLIRDESQKMILELMQQVNKYRGDVQVLMNELNNSQNSKDEEIKSRISGILTNLLAGTWRKVSESGLTGRSNVHSIVTGNKLVLWGGDQSALTYPLNDGAIYNIDDNTWKSMAKCPIEGRIFLNSILSGNKVIFWGGGSCVSSFNDGAIYDIEKDSWIKMSASPLEKRHHHTSLLAGKKLIIWGGTNWEKCFNDGAIYDIEKDSWSKIKDFPLEGRYLHKALPYKEKLIIWGGASDGGKTLYSNGAIYDIENDSWVTMKECSLETRYSPTLVLSGDRLIVWGGVGKDKKVFKDGAIYDISKNSWTVMKESPIEGRSSNTAVVFYSKLVIWGGHFTSKFMDDGAIYDLKTNTWSTMPLCPLSGRAHTPILINDKIFIWGGTNGPDLGLADGAIYDIKRGTWITMKEFPLAARKSNVLAVLGNKLIVWGGTDSGKYFNDGAIYEPSEFLEYDNDKILQTHSVEKLKKLLKQLDDDSPTVRDEAQLAIIKLFKSVSKEEAKTLASELKAFKKNNKLVESKARLDQIISELTEGSWKSMKECPVEFRYTTGHQFGDKFIFWGGRYAKFFDDGALYDISKDEWKEISHSPLEARAPDITLPYENKLIIWGGFSREKGSDHMKPLNDGAVYDTTKDSWTKMKASPISTRYETNCVLFKDNLVIWAGYNPTGDNLKCPNDGAIYSITQDSWKKMKKCPLEGRSCLRPIIFDNKLIIWGGAADGKYYNDGAIYDLETDSWKIIKDSSLKERMHPFSRVINKKMLIWGGSASTRFNDGAIYDIERDSWIKISPSPVTVNDSSYSFNFQDKFISIDFFPDHANYYNKGAVYDINKDYWVEIKECPLEPRSSPTKVLIEDNVYIWGGYRTTGNQKWYNDGAIYNMKTYTWTKMNSCYLKPRSGSVSIVAGNKLIIWGGHGRDDTHSKINAYNDGAIYEIPPLLGYAFD